MSVEEYFVHLEKELVKIEKDTMKASFFQFKNTKPILGTVFNFIFLLGFLSITYLHAEPVLYFDSGLVHLSIIKFYFLLSLLAPTLLIIYYFSFRWFFNNRSKEATNKEKMKVREIAFFSCFIFFILSSLILSFVYSEPLAYLVPNDIHVLSIHLHYFYIFIDLIFLSVFSFFLYSQYFNNKKNDKNIKKLCELGHLKNKIDSKVLSYIENNIHDLNGYYKFKAICDKHDLKNIKEKYLYNAQQHLGKLHDFKSFNAYEQDVLIYDNKLKIKNY